MGASRGCILTLDSKASRAEPFRQHSTWLILTVTASGAFITALDQTVVVTALPSVMLDLKIPITELDRVSWIITAYLLGYTVAMPLIGRIGDVYGYPRVYQASLIVFCIGTSLVAIAQSFEFMIGARVIQAIGGGATVPLGMALATTLVPPEKRALALGVVGGAAEAGSMLGPAYGGAIVELSSWRWIFWLNVPQSAIVFVALMRLPNHRTPGGKVDYLGGAVLIAALFLLAMGLSRKDFFTIESPVPFILAASGLGLGGVLVLVERRVWQPLLAQVFLRSWQFILANISQALVGVSLILAMGTVPLTADTVMLKDPFTGAMWLLRMTGVIPIASVVGGWMLPWAGGRVLTVVGLLMVAAGLFMCSRWEIGVDDPELTLQLLANRRGVRPGDRPHPAPGPAGGGRGLPGDSRLAGDRGPDDGHDPGAGRDVGLGRGALPGPDLRPRAPPAADRGVNRGAERPHSPVYRGHQRRGADGVPRILPRRSHRGARRHSVRPAAYQVGVLAGLVAVRELQSPRP